MRVASRTSVITHPDSSTVHASTKSIFPQLICLWHVLRCNMQKFQEIKSGSMNADATTVPAFGGGVVLALTI